MLSHLVLKLLNHEDHDYLQIGKFPDNYNFNFNKMVNDFSGIGIYFYKYVNIYVLPNEVIA